MTPNDVLKEIVFLQEQQKAVEERIKHLKDYCKARGGFATTEYVCLVSEQTRTTMAPLEDVLRVFEQRQLEAAGLIRKAKFYTVRVARRAPGQTIDV